MWLIITILLFTTYCASAKIDYCSGYLFNSSLNSDYLQFTKELSSSEYSVVNSFKSLHCCAKGYRSIEWFKDGKPYPWATDVSTFILYPESANQTIYAQSLATIDAGNYTCVVADNAAQSLVHNVNLNVFDMSGYSDDPLSTYELPSQHFVRIGETARLFCEAFIGKMDIPDAVNEITWSRPGMNTTVLLSNRRVFKKDIFREGDQILGSYFIIRNVKRSDFGEYTCSVRNSGDQVIYMKTFLNELDWPSDKRNFSVPWLKVTVLVTIIVVCAVSMATICQHLILSLLLFLRNICWKRHDDGGKLFDILICYTSSDADFIKTTLGVTLQKKYGYKVVYKQLIDPSLAMIASQCSSILLIGSPGMCSDDMWTPKNIYNLLKYITSISNQVVFIPAKPLPNDESLKSEDGEKLQQILKNVCVVNFRSNKQSDVRLFWIKLRLALPSLKRNNSCISSSSSPSSSTSFLNEGFDLNHMNVTESMNTKISLVLTKSTDSIEVLV